VQSTIRLFKALPVDDHNAIKTDDWGLETTLPKGFVFTPEVIQNYQNLPHLVALVNQAYGRSSEELNQTFHKSWAKVRDTPIERLVFEQILHYMTTYGAERAGVYDENNVFIPGEILEAPELKDGIRLVVIRGLTKDEIKTELMKLLDAGVALHENTLKDVIDVATWVGLTEPEVTGIKNKEAKAALYDYFGFVPTKPVDFLRHVVYRATEKTLLIKNKGTTEAIKARQNTDITRLFDIYEKEVGLASLAEIFYRYKPIFLAFRTNTKLKKTINKIRRLAVANHKPMQEDLLNNITARLKHREAPDAASFNEAMSHASIFRKTRLAYALKFRTTDADAILYRVRNGKSYAKEFDFTNKRGAEIMYQAVMKLIVKDVAENVAGKKIFIPAGLKYGLPATEKQFTGNLPTGTYVELSEDLVCGIHWENVGHSRIDLDLSIQNATDKFGWDASYRNGSGDILFSGDITDAPAPNGASELFHVGGTARGAWLMNVNYYNFMAETPVPFKIIVAHDTKSNVESHRTVDPNNIIAQATAEMTVKQKQLGIIVATDESTKFYFAETGVGGGVTAKNNEHAEQARKFLLKNYTDSIVLNDVLTQAGAIIVDTDPLEADIDLSPEAVDKTTILDLLKKKEA
jgi:hypothetical protein